MDFIVSKQKICILLTENLRKLFTPQKGFPGGSVVKNPPVNVGDAGLIPGLGRSPGEGNWLYPLQYSCLGNHKDQGGVSKESWGHKRVRHDLVTKQQQQILGGAVSETPEHQKYRK